MRINKLKITDDLKFILLTLMDMDIESAVGRYSQVCLDPDFLQEVKNHNSLITSSLCCCNFLQIKARYFQFLLDFFPDFFPKTTLIHGKNTLQIQKIIQKTTLYSPPLSAFQDRIKEWKALFSNNSIPFITKDKVGSFFTQNDTVLFESLIQATPNYILRRLQLPNWPDYARIVNILDLVERKNLRILDYGCGSADVSLYLATKGFDITIVDISGGNLEPARKRFEIRSLPVTAIGATPTKPIPDLCGTYDIIIALEVIEHVRHPFELLNLFKRASHRGTILLLGSFPFNPTTAVGDHLIESVSKQQELKNTILKNWKRINSNLYGNTFIN
jgi:2-polyprenyl-3-methyl-5-hydroxy-6-metoxy-1,4-benzoquinol methylase